MGVFDDIQKFIAEKKIPPLRIYVDSPMGVEVSKVHVDFPADYDEQTRAMLGRLNLFGLSQVTFASSGDRDVPTRRITGSDDLGTTSGSGSFFFSTSPGGTTLSFVLRRRRHAIASNAKMPNADCS